MWIKAEVSPETLQGARRSPSSPVFMRFYLYFYMENSSEFRRQKQRLR
jgi:hypothetical protein